MNLRQKLYDFIFTNKNFPTSTANLYLKFLQKLEVNTKILDIGVGTGVYFENEDCVKIIKEKNIQIYGIDINESDIKLANKKIIKNNLSSNVSVEYRDLFDVDDFNVYDTIVFSESYPVIEFNLMFLMLNYILREKSYKNKVFFINNITENPTRFQRMVKPRLKYLLCGIDFGRFVTPTDMMNMFKKLKINDSNIKFEKLSSVTINYNLFRDKIKIPGCDFVMHQYLVTINS